MTDRADLTIVQPNTAELATATGTVAVLIEDDGTLYPLTRKADRLVKGALARLADSEAFEKAEAGSGFTLDFPAGMAADVLVVVKLAKRPSVLEARRAGAFIAAKAKGDRVKIAVGSHLRAADIVTGYMLRDYRYSDMRSGDAPQPRKVTVGVNKADELNGQMLSREAVAEGVFLARDLVNAPANHLTTAAFASKIESMAESGLKIEIIGEDRMEEMGMGALLGVGLGSESSSYLAVMHWNGGGDEAPLALVGKGVVFDTGGISMKPAAGMEAMTMDMGGAATVCGAMLTLARRKAKANVVGLVGLVENMPDGKAQRPGDIVTSMKGDTIEVINTDAEGRLVLADALWYAQEAYNPVGIIDLATLTGAALVALGHERAAVYSTDETLASAFLSAAEAEGEGAWRMPLGSGYAKLLKSDLADVKNVGGRWGGSVTAAEFLRRFVKQGTPWIHLDIAGTASQPTEVDPMAPKGATGWGVRALDRLVREMLEA